MFIGRKKCHDILHPYSRYTYSYDFCSSLKKIKPPQWKPNTAVRVYTYGQNYVCNVMYVVDKTVRLNTVIIFVFARRKTTSEIHEVTRPGAVQNEFAEMRFHYYKRPSKSFRGIYNILRVK